MPVIPELLESQILTRNRTQAGGKDCKAELRDHDHVVECVAWAPEAATQVITKHLGGDLY